jgi:hypothetical protein
MEPIHAELDGSRKRPAGVSGIASSRSGIAGESRRVVGHHDAEKVAEAVSVLVSDGMPPSSLELRELLLPILDELPGAEGRPAAYERVITDLNLHRERRSRTSVPAAAPRKPVSEDVARAAELLRGREIVLIGGERRVEAERAVIDVFGLSGLEWFTISDNPTLPELERAIAKDEVAVVLQLIRWSRHRFGDAAQIAAEYDKPFIRVPRGYNPNALAKAILEQASERLRNDQRERHRL